MSALNALTAVVDLSFLSTQINEAHFQVTYHARSMLLEAKLAGDALIAAKRMVRHGEFKAWVEGNCRCSYRQSMKYMAVAKQSKLAPQGNFEGGINAFLEAHAKPRETPQEPVQEAPAPFTRADAEYALKLAAMAERGGTEHERATAERKLSGFAQGFGMDAEEVVRASHLEAPHSGLSADEAALRETKDELAAIRKKMEALLKRRAEVLEQFEAMSHEELLEWAVAKALQEEFLDASY